MKSKMKTPSLRNPKKFYIHKRHNIEITFPNIEVKLRIFQLNTLLFQMQVANDQFKSLKRVKNCQKPTVKDQKLNDVAVLFIENDVLEKLDKDLIINKFVDLKERKKNISLYYIN